MLRSESAGTAELRALEAAAVSYDLALTAAIDQLLRDSDLSYRDLAYRCGMSEGTVWNRLHVGGFRPAEQFKVAHALGTDVETLVRSAQASCEGAAA